MKPIIEKLKESGHFDAHIGTELQSLWRFGIEKISELTVRETLISFLRFEVPLSFFVDSASLSGRHHHPAWQCRSGGILRNTVECCVAVDRQLQIYPEYTNDKFEVIPVHRDIVLAATILSDTFKYGEVTIATGQREGPCLPDHGRIAAERWDAIAIKRGVPSDMRIAIYEATYWHLGRWTPGWTAETKLSRYAEITHRIDMIFSDSMLEVLYTPKEQIQ